MNIPVWCISVLNSFQYLISFCMNKGIWNSTYQVPIPRDMVWSISQWHTIEFNQKSTNMISKRIHGAKKNIWRKESIESIDKSKDTYRRWSIHRSCTTDTWTNTTITGVRIGIESDMYCIWLRITMMWGRYSILYQTWLIHIWYWRQYWCDLNDYCIVYLIRLKNQFIQFIVIPAICSKW